MAEAAGFAIGIVGLAGQLVKLSRECTNIFSDMKEIGYAQDSVLHDLREQGLRLKHWEHAWGLDGTSQQHQHIEPDDERYRYAVAGLARIIAVFAKLAALQARYQSEPQKDDKSAKRDSLGVGRLLSKFRSKSPSPGKTKPGRATSPSPQPSISSISPSDLRLLENPKIFSNTQLLPALEEEIACLARAVQNVQQSVSAYRKLRWASSDKARCHELVGQLTKYIDGLFNVLPPNATIPRLSERKLLHLSFDIPFSLPNFRRNSDFVGREHLLEQLKQKIKGAATGNAIQVVLYGMGGVGKTQLALEYAYRHHGDYSAVFWVNAASEQTTKLGFTYIMQQLIKHHAKLCDEPDYMHIGRLLGMAGKLNSVGLFTVQDPSEEQYVVDAVKEWFAAKDNTKWLLVFDNLDDLRSFDINNYIPSSSYGTVIITSRRRESVHGRGWIEVDQMTKIEAEELLLKSAKRAFEKVTEGDCEHEKEAAATIVQKLGYLPLAIDQAGACIYALDSSFSHYLSEYENKVTYLLSTEWKLGTHDRAVFAAWDLSFNAIQEQNANAAELLLLCGFLDNNDICEELLQRGMKLPMNDSIRVLFSYSMVKRKDRDDSFSIHPIVHKWAQWKLNAEPERYNKKATEALLIVTSAIAVPDNKREVADWIFERRILPHIIALEKHAKTLPIGNQEILMAVDNLGAVYKGMLQSTIIAVLFDTMGQYDKALEYYQRALVGREKALGTEHPDTLTIVNNIARALVGREKALGTEHPDTLTTVNNIAVLFHDIGQYDKALEYYQRALSTTLLFIQDMGQYDKALEYYQRALVGREKALGTEHPDTLTTVNNIAALFQDMGQHDKALDQQHCRFIQDMGQYDKALEYYQRALVGREKALGTEHPDTLTTVNNIAALFQDMGQHDKALEYFQRALYDKALEYYQRALVGREKALGTEHPDTLTTVNNIAALFNIWTDNKALYDKALEYCQRALVGREKALGTEHPSTLTTVNNIAALFQDMGQHDKALEYFQRALVGCEKALGTEHPIHSYYSQQHCCFIRCYGTVRQSTRVLQRALVGRQKVLGLDHPDTLATINYMATLLDEIGHSDQAQKLRERTSHGSSANANE
ncbi:hypothetical protein BDZ91DRAFT_852054 [Kalaharituber pfeilii]|nr:hypothetical protein BDZ91DRAFT_852054 [Kalaharituber pfeilii]